jgi:hypothetical protein
MKDIVSNLQEHLSQGKQLNLEFLNNLYHISRKMATSKASKCINAKIVVKTSERLLAPSSITFTKKN